MKLISLSQRAHDNRLREHPEKIDMFTQVFQTFTGNAEIRTEKNGEYTESHC